MGPQLKKTIDELLAAYAQRDTEGILFYSRDRERDFENQREKLAQWRRRLDQAAFADQVEVKLGEVTGGK